jgi:hypothetical protein
VFFGLPPAHRFAQSPPRARPREGPWGLPSLCANVRETGSPVEFNVEGGGVMMHDPLSQKNASRRFLGNGRSA